MRPAPRRAAPLLALLAAGALIACDTAEERAEEHYRRGMELVAEGDVERARVEFRNVFRLNGAHTAARLHYARLLRDEEPHQAIRHYIRLVEQDRDSVPGHRELVELAIRVHDFETAGRHVGRALALAPDDPEIRAFQATLDFRAGETDAALALAREVVADAPGTVAASMVLIADRRRAGDPAAALARADAALAHAPRDEGLHLVRLRALEELGDDAAVGAALATMAQLFPGNPGVREALVRHHLDRGDADAAEAVLRRAAAAAPEDAQAQLAVARFLYESRGAGPAAAELDRLAAAAADPLPYARARAGLDFAEGRTAEAIAALRRLADGAAPSDAVRDLQVDLAGMLAATGETAARDALLATVLEGDPTHVAALKLRARAAIAADRPEQAIRDMRAALGQAPRDPEIMTIMAEAHLREGARELAGERLALAVEASGNAAAESLRYARFLMGEDRLGPAEGVLAAGLRRAPEDPELLAALGEVHLARGDWPRARRVAALLRAAGDPTAAAAADRLEAASLAAEGRRDETVALLEDLAAGGGDAAALAELVRSHVAAGDLAAARARVEGVLAEDPGSLAGRMLRAGLHVIEGETDRAEALYRELAAAAPARPEPHRALFALLSGLGRAEAARAALEDGLAAAGDDPELLVAKAGLLEAEGEIEAAIALYEALYARDTGSAVVANNLASLIATHRDDAESLERAFRIARRLRGSDVPQFQDTYGWILARRGDPGQAIGYLEPAAAALGADPLVQFHLGMAYLALDRAAEARAALARAVALADPARPLPQIAEARARIAEIDARPAPPSGG